jgi:hypothetical protein
MADQKNEKVQAQAKVIALTPEEVEKQKALEAKRNARKAARQRVFEALKKIADPKLTADVMLFVGKERVPGTGIKSVNADLRDALLKAGTEGLSEMDVFRSFKIGRPEMVTKVRILVLTPNPDDRVWVKFDESKERYFVVGKGAEPPKGWTGYVPGKKEQL